MTPSTDPVGGSTASRARRILEPWISARSGTEPVVLTASAPDDPYDPERDARGERGPEQSVEGPEPGEPRACTHASAESLKATRAHPADEQRADETEQRRIL